MAEVGNTYLTLVDLYKQQEGKGEVTASIIELLAETNPILEDMIVQECNNGTGHLTTVRTGLPSATWRKLYQGVQPSKATNRQVTDSTGMLEAWSEVDSKLVALSKNPGQFRLNEATAFIEAMNQEMASGLFYHDTATDPDKFMGLAPRFNTLSGADTSAQIINGGGSGSDNTSIWFIVWGDRTCHGLYPEGSMAGLQREDKGQTTKEVSDGSLYDVHREKFCWDLGFTVRDYRYISRVANIDVSDLNAGTVDVEDLMIDAYYALYQRKVTGGRAAIYCNTTVKKALHKLAKNQANVNLTLDNFEGREIVRFLGIPIRETDAILDTEAAVS